MTDLGRIPPKMGNIGGFWLNKHRQGPGTVVMTVDGRHILGHFDALGPSPKLLPNTEIGFLDPPDILPESTVAEYWVFVNEVVKKLSDILSDNAALIVVVRESKGAEFVHKMPFWGVVPQLVGWRPYRHVIWEYTNSSDEVAGYHRSQIPFAEIFFFRRGYISSTKTSPWRYRDIILAPKCKPSTNTTAPEMPDEIVRGALSLFAQPDRTVVDLFMGSGATMRMARELGMKSWGFELMDSRFQALRDELYPAGG